MTPGDVLGARYQLEIRLGKGGMGEVWRARHLETGRRVAVKVLLDEHTEDRALHKRFLREARAAAAVKHPNVVELLEVQEGDDGVPFLVMELLRGETLGKRLKRKGALSVSETAAILLPVFDAVEAAHAAGLVHRDLKPENVFLAREPGATTEPVRVCVLDFGIAKQVEKLAAPVTASSAETTAAPETTGAMLGTPYYMAPEQALGERDIDSRADIWALGVILYECLAGQRPTEAATLGAILKVIVTDGVVPLGERVPDLDATLVAAVMRMLRTSRDERASTLDEIRAVLESQRPSSFLLESSTLETGEEGPPSLAPRSEVRARRSSRVLLVLGGGVAAALVAALALRSSDRATPSVEPVLAVSTPSSITNLTNESAPAPAHSAEASAAPVTSASAPPVTKAANPPPRAPARVAPQASSTATATASSGPGRGPSGLVTDNPFGGPTR